MNRIALVVSDVDGTLLTKDKVLTEAAIGAVRKLHEAGIGFTIISSRPSLGMRFFVEPLQLKLPFGAFNGSCVLNPDLTPIEQHAIPPSAAKRAIDLLNQFGTDLWLFTSDLWLARDESGHYVPLERRAIRSDPTIVADFTPYLASACKIVGSSTDAAMLETLEAAMQEALGTEATAVRSQSYYLDITPPGFNKGTFVTALAKRLGLPKEAIATIGDMQNDLPMFTASGVRIAMGNAIDDVKRAATHVTSSNQEEGFAGAIEMILKGE
jgi:Cof subfamily protein (haloacid dehalogenase superfamily)